MTTGDDNRPPEANEPNTLVLVIGGAALALLLCLGAGAYFVMQTWSPAPRVSPSPAASATSADRQSGAPGSGTTSAPGSLPGVKSKVEPQIIVLQPGPGMGRTVRSSPPKIKRVIDLEKINQVGEVYVGQVGENLLSSEWSQMVLTSGAVAVPENVIIKLRADWDLSDLSGLLKLKPGDVDMLDLSRAKLNGAGLAPVSHLTGLQALRLEGPGIDDGALKHIQKLRALELLEFRDCPITDAGLDVIAGLPRLRVLSLREARITRDGLKMLGRMKTLIELDIVNVPVADHDLTALSNMPNLVRLRLSSNGVSDKGLVFLKDQPALRELELSRNPVNGSGLSCFRGRTLKWLSLADTRADDAGLTGIVGINTLAVLFLDNTAITDQSMSTLLKLPKLWATNLARTRITDAGALQLHGCKNLRLLNLPSQISRTAIAKLKALLPQCKIEQADRWPF